MIAPGALEDEFPGSTPSRLLHLSDTHFGTEVPAVADALKRLCEQQRPEVAVLSGDVTQRARPGQFAAAARFLKTLAVPQTLVLPGNHDVPLFDLPARLMRPYAQFQAAFGYELESLYSDAHWLVITVNTTRWYRHKNGEIDPVQIDTVAARLRQRHAEPVAGGGDAPSAGGDQRGRPRQPAAAPPRQALAAWAEAGVDLVLGGHIHLPYVTPVEPQAEAGAGSRSSAESADSGHPDGDARTASRVGGAGRHGHVVTHSRRHPELGAPHHQRQPPPWAGLRGGNLAVRRRHGRLSAGGAAHAGSLGVRGAGGRHVSARSRHGVSAAGGLTGASPTSKAALA